MRGNFFAGETFCDLADAQRRVEAWCTTTAGLRVHGTNAQRPVEHFAEVEAHRLLPVPDWCYDVPVSAHPKVARDRHVEVARALYSVPGELIGQRLHARADSRLVKLYQRGQLIKTHPRKPPGGRSTDAADLPEGMSDYALRDVASLRHKAAAAGRSVGVYAQRILDVPLPWTSMRSVYRLLGLCRTYGPAAVDAACARALELDVIDIKKITRILERAIEAQPTLFPAKVVGGSTHCARDNSEYRSGYRGELRAGQPAATALFDPLLERMALAKQQSLPYADFLSLVFADEVERRDRTSADLRSRTAKLDLAVRNRVVQQRQPGPVTTANSGTNCAR